MKSEDTPSGTSLPASVDGQSLCASPGGTQLDLFSQEVVPVSPTPLRAGKQVKKTNVTSGRISIGSPESCALSASLASKLMERLDSAGSIEFSLTWAMPAMSALR